MQKYTQIKIRRFKPLIESEPHYQQFDLVIGQDKTVLDALQTIQAEQDCTLMFRHSCHHSSCGTCGMIINGQERLACITRISALASGPVTLEPLCGFPVIGDLVVDMSGFFQHIDDDFDYIKAAENLGHIQLPTGISQFVRLENCIECGCCVSACPVSKSNTSFLGPAALAALNVELNKASDRHSTLLQRAKNHRGEPMCERALACSRVCPTKVYPARHIFELRKR